MSGVMRTSVRPRRPWRMISCPAANGMRCVKPSSATVCPSFTNRATASASGMIFVVMGISSMWNGVPAAIPDVRLFGDKLRPGTEEIAVMEDEKKPGVDRRAFLKTAMAGAGATAAAAATPLAAAATQVAQAEPAKEKKAEGSHEANDMIV